MRILDKETDKTLKDIILLLTVNEASELRDSLESILKEIDYMQHEHINDIGYEHEISIALYNYTEINSFDKRIRKLILNDE
jgi:hypothetical protein